MSDVTFGTWNAAASPLIIEYSLVVIEEIRHEVAEGFQKLSRGGIEVGGLLYGVREGQTIRIMAIRPVACEHAGGPTFRLSERDRAALQEQIRQDQSDQRLEDLVCVGWYVSHTRTEIALSDSDQEIFASFFAHPLQVTLVIRPSRGGNMRAGFFVREPDGTVNASQSYLEFNFPDRLAAAFDQRGERRSETRVDPRPEPRLNQRLEQRREPRGPSAERERQAADPSVLRIPRSLAGPPAASAHAASAQAAPPPAVPTPGVPASTVPLQDYRNDLPHSGPASSQVTSLFGERARPSDPGPAESALGDSAQTKPSRKKWLWLVAALIVVAGLAVAGTRFLSPGLGYAGLRYDNMALSVLERDGQLDIEWNRQAAPVATAIGGSLEITDGSQTRTIVLKPADLALGKISYKRDTGDVQVRMIVEGPGGEKTQKASRFFGSPPAKTSANDLITLQKRKDELDAEVGRLKQSNDQQAQRIQQLERTLKILQTRQGN